MTIEAIYENGVFRPTQPLELKEGDVVEIIVVPKDQSPGRKAFEIVSQIAALPMEEGGIEFSGVDHDKILYGPDGVRRAGT